MLSRTADHLFWMARYMERAENTARMLDIALKARLLPQGDAQENRSLRAVLRISELEPAFAERGEPLTQESVLRFLVSDARNPSSIYCFLQAARENARAVRGTLTTEAWETINATWLRFGQLLHEDLLTIDPGSLFEWVKYRSHLSRGVTTGTAYYDDAYFFTRLGTFLERADNTARILDVRFLDAEREQRDPADTSAQLEDFYYWTSILSSVSALEIYRKVYRDVVTSERVIDLLMFNRNMPRSLLAALDGVCDNLAKLRNDYSHNCEREAGKLRAELQYADIPQILDGGLHAYLTQFLSRVYDLGNRVSETFLLLPVA